jgi:hypothetical protein
MTDTDDHVAERIAERGRGALLERLRPAFRDAADAHSDLIQLDHDQLEQMVQRAADRADGLQWRRALASVATEELGIGLGEALGHPAVERAQRIVGAPSYEESLAELGLVSETKAFEDGAAEPEIDPEVVSEDASELAAAEAEAAVEEVEHEEHVAVEDAALEAQDESEQSEPESPDDAATDPSATEPSATEPSATESSEPERPEPDSPVTADASTLRVNAIHQGGIANLAPEEGGLEIQLSEAGLDIARDDGDILGRLPWNEIDAIEVPAARGMRRRRKRDAQLVVKTSQGEATFSIPSVTPDEFRQLLNPVVERHRPVEAQS